jgi:hypothetical protein
MYVGEFVYSMTRTRENRKRMKNKPITRERKDGYLGIYIDRHIQENRKKPIDLIGTKPTCIALVQIAEIHNNEEMGLSLSLPTSSSPSPQGHVGLVMIEFFNRICTDFIHTISIPHEFYVEDLIGDDHGDKLAQTIFFQG